MSDQAPESEMSDRVRELEYKRGKADAEHGYPPVALAGPYMQGYCSVPRHRRQVIEYL